MTSAEAAYSANRPWASRVIGFALVILLHLAAAYALVKALAHRSVIATPVLIETQIVAETPRAPEPVTIPKPVEPSPPIQNPPPVQAPASPRPPPPPRHAELRVETKPSSSPPQTAIVAPPPEPVAPPAPAQSTPVQIMPHLDLQHSHEPEYPVQSRQLGEQGSVVLQVLVGVDGGVLETKLVQSSGYDRLDQAALRELKTSYRFIPGTIDGKPQPMWYMIKYNWKLR